MNDTETFLYRHFDAEGVLLYVGVSNRWERRLKQHGKTSEWFDQITQVKIEKFLTRQDALDAETTAIQVEKPKHNIQKVRTCAPSRAMDIVLEQRDKLVYQITTLYPMYSVSEAAEVLMLGETYVKHLIETKQLGSVFVCNRTKIIKGVEKVYPIYHITGFQLLEFIETLQETGKVP